jgi:hypothetical protein
MFVARSAPGWAVRFRVSRVSKDGFRSSPGGCQGQVKRASRVASRWLARGPTTIVLARSHRFSLLDPSLVTFVWLPFSPSRFLVSERRPQPKEGSLARSTLPPHSPASMTVAALPLSNIQRSFSFSPLSSSRPSSSPATIHVFPPQDRSGTMPNISPDSSSPIPHISCTSVISICRPRHLCSFPVADVGGAIQRRLPDAVSERHSAFITSRSRALKASRSPFVMYASLNSISSSTTSLRSRLFFFETSSSIRT